MTHYGTVPHTISSHISAATPAIGVVPTELSLPRSEEVKKTQAALNGLLFLFNPKTHCSPAPQRHSQHELPLKYSRYPNGNLISPLTITFESQLVVPRDSFERLGRVSYRMPSLEVDSYGVPAVTTFVSYFEEVLVVAASAKSTTTIEPALEESDLQDVLSRWPAASTTVEVKKEGAGNRKNQQFAVIETAVRGIQSNLIVRRACRALPNQLSSPYIGDSIHRFTRIRQGVEPVRHSIDIIGSRTMRPCSSSMASGGIA